MKPGRDSQRSRVYAWEQTEIAPHDPTEVAFANVQGMVNAIWSEAGLKYPPKVEPLAAQSTTTLAQATRLSIQVPPKTPAWIILHEVAHAMTATHDGNSDGHGSLFMGLYVGLLTRYMRLPRDVILASLRLAAIDIKLDALPVFINER